MKPRRTLEPFGRWSRFIDVRRYTYITAALFSCFGNPLLQNATALLDLRTKVDKVRDCFLQLFEALFAPFTNVLRQPIIRSNLDIQQVFDS